MPDSGAASLLDRTRLGDADAFDQLVGQRYGELRHIAQSRDNVVIEARREEAEAAAALAAPIMDDDLVGDELDVLVETPESRE